MNTEKQQPKQYLPDDEQRRDNVREEAVAALVMLGFVKATSQKVVTKILKDSPGLTVEQVIKAALRML